MQNIDYSILDGNEWDVSDNASMNIWISQDENIENKRIGEVVTMALEGVEKEFTIKGIVSGENSFVSYRTVQLSSFHVMAIDCDYTNMTVYKSLRAIDKELTDAREGRVIVGATLDNYIMSEIVYYVMAVICGFLMIICILFGIGSAVNALWMSVENNEKFMGILRAMGMSDGKIHLFIIMQQIVVLLMATIIALIIAVIISKICLPVILNSLLGMALGGMELVISSSISIWAIALNLIVLTIVLLIGSSRVMKKYFKSQIISSL